MQRRSFLPMLAAPAILRGQAGRATKPNVILILTDDQGYGDLSAHGNPVLKTPHLDKLRESSTRLTDFHVAPMCTPTRGQLMTGRHALVNLAMNVSSGRTPLRTDLPTMADIFRGSGYSTGLFGKWHLGDSYPYRPQDRGFDESVWFPSSHVSSVSDYWNNDYYNDTYRHNGRDEKYSGYCTDVFFEQAMNWMRARKENGKPFFTYLATNAPHGPLFVPEEYSKRYADQPQNVANFFGMIANIDENLGKLEAMLRTLGIADNTILIFITDNGATAGLRVHNAGMRAGKVTLWDGGHRVPFFIRWPKGGIGAGKDIPELTEVRDVLPTLVDLCGLEMPEGVEFEGANLGGLLRGRAAPALRDRMRIVQFSRMNVGRPQWGDATVMWRKWRLVNRNELYDLSVDPGQMRNAIRDNGAIAARMRSYYDEWWRDVESRFDTFLPTYVGSDEQNPVLVSPTEWADSFLDQSGQVRSGVRKNGLWHIHADRAGEYEFRLRRWPQEANVAIRDAVAEHRGECGRFPAGVALPIAKAGLTLAGRPMFAPVAAADGEVVFRGQLPEGRATMQSYFFDSSDRELCGAYYVYARRLTP